MLQGRNGDPDIFPVCIESDIYQVIFSLYGFIAGKTDAKGPGVFRKLCYLCIYIVGTNGVHTTDCIGQFLTYDRMILAVADHKFEEFEQIAVFFKQIPVQPGNFIVLAISVVVSGLRITEFIPGQKHWRSSAAHEYCAGIADHSETKGKDIRIRSIPFHSTVPAPVVVGTIRIIPAVCFIVLFIIGIKIIKGKTIVAGKEINTGIVAGIVIIVF